MNQQQIRKVALIGAGNVAWHLGHTLAEAGIHITQVVSQSLSSARALAEAIGASYTDKLQALVQDPDAYIMSVSDDAIADIIQHARFGDKIVMHTAGSVSMNVFRHYIKNHGVLYPLQTFTKGKQMNLKDVPFFIEANNSFSLSGIRKLAGLLSGHVFETDSRKRMKIHLAAVFACNFTNHMYALAEMILRNENLPFEILKPLIRETMLKAVEISPLKAQTGPAQRGSSDIINRHMSMLEDDPELQQLYGMVSRSIERMNSANEI